MLGAKELIQHHPFKPIREPHVAGKTQQLQVELQPGDRDTSLADIVGVRQFGFIVIPLSATGGAREIELVIDDILPRNQGSLE